jgi:hypothetical protein
VLESAFDANRRLCYLRNAAGDRGRGTRRKQAAPLRTTASAELNWRNGFSLAGTFEDVFSDVTRSDAGKDAGRYPW